VADKTLAAPVSTGIALFPTLKPASRQRLMAAAAAFATVALPASNALAQAVTGGNTLGSRMQAVSTDMTNGGGYLLTLFGFILGGFALIAGGWTIYQHTKNPNGQAKLGYGVAGVLAGGFFLTIASIATFSSQTISGAGASSTGTSKAMTFQ
jgi:hypothetical protein